MQTSAGSRADTAARSPQSSPGETQQASTSGQSGSMTTQGRQAYHQQWHFAPNSAGIPLARFLGFFSIGLGLAELIAPRLLARGVGLPERPGLTRALGMREIAAGVGILSQKQPSNWLWARVAGDAMDLAVIGLGASNPRARRNRAGVAAAMVAGVTALDILASVQQTRRERKQGPVASNEGVYIETSIAINKSPRECYDFWRNFENLPRFMEHLEAVEVKGQGHSHWRARGPAGSSVEWDAEVTADQPGELLAWHSLPGADVEHAGTVRFDPGFGGRGTLMRVEMQYRPPGGFAGAMVASMFNEEPSQQIADDLRRFRWLMETGEIPTTIGQPSGPRSMMSRMIFRKGLPG